MQLAVLHLVFLSFSPCWSISTTFLLTTAVECFKKFFFLNYRSLPVSSNSSDHSPLTILIRTAARWMRGFLSFFSILSNWCVWKSQECSSLGKIFKPAHLVLTTLPWSNSFVGSHFIPFWCLMRTLIKALDTILCVALLPHDRRTG